MDNFERLQRTLLSTESRAGLDVVASFWANCGPWGKGLAHCHLYKM